MDEKKKSMPKGTLRQGAERRSHFRMMISEPRDTLKGVLLALMAFLLGNCPLPFATYPLGLALLCASSEGTLYVAAGLIAASFTMPLPPTLPIAVTVGTLLVRILARVFIDLPARIGGDGRQGEVWEHLKGRLFCEGLYLRMACVCVSVFAMSLYAIIRGGFRYYDLFGALFSMVVAPVSVFLFAGLFEGEYDRLFEGRIAAVLTHLSYIAASTALCRALADVTLTGIPLSVAFAFVATVALCRHRGLIPATCAGLLCGLVLEPLYAPILAISAVAAYCIFDVSPMLAAAVACIAGTVCGVLMTGSGAVSAVFLPLFSGTAVYCTAEKLRRREPVKEPPPPLRADHSAEHLASQTAGALRLANTLRELSETVTAISERRKKPSAADLRGLCDTCFDQLCPHCTAREACWETGYHTMLNSLDSLTLTLSDKGELTPEDLPDPLAKDCPGATHFVNLVNEGMADLTMNSVCSEKTEIFAMDYLATSTLLRELCQTHEEDHREDERLSAAVSARLRDLGFASESVSVTGKRLKRLTVRGISPCPDGTKTDYLIGQLSSVCGFPLTAPRVEENGTLTAIRAASVEAACGSSFSAHESVCGDVISVFRDEDRGYLYAILNDGMGAGKEAAFTAQLASLFLRKLIPAGASPETALRMLNHFLRLGRNKGNTESSTTVDLLILDLLECRATFVKSGAAPTYVKRGKNIFYLDSKTAPVGILRELDAKQIDFELRDGDTIVMVSDGITEGDNECLWLLDHLDATDCEDPHTLADHLVKSAAERGHADDLSAITLRIKLLPQAPSA